MRNLLCIAVLLLSAAWVAAQSSSSPSSSSSSDQAASSSSQTTPSNSTSTNPSNSGNETKVEGCLNSSNGSYTLTARDGTTYQLSGDTSQLSEHVGHEVQISGTTSSASASNSSSSSSTTPASSGGMSSSSQPTLNVASIKHISKTCSAGSSSR